MSRTGIDFIRIDDKLGYVQISIDYDEETLKEYGPIEEGRALMMALSALYRFVVKNLLDPAGVKLEELNDILTESLND